MQTAYAALCIITSGKYNEMNETFMLDLSVCIFDSLFFVKIFFESLKFLHKKVVKEFCISMFVSYEFY